MTKTLEKQLNKLELWQLFEVAQELDSIFWAYEDLKDFAIDKIKDDYLKVAIHILSVLDDYLEGFFYYDASMGVLEKVIPITSKRDFIEILKDYDDEKIEEILQNYQGGF